MNDPNVSHETKNSHVGVLFERDWRRDVKNESMKGVLRNESSRK